MLLENLARDWRNNPKLSFDTILNEDSGELVGGKKWIKYNGLVFEIYQPNKINGKEICMIKGSLHKYYNKGKGNYNDFGISELKEVIKDLEQFGVKKELAIIQTLEFGVNINLKDEKASRIIRNTIAYGHKGFSAFRPSKKILGKWVAAEQYEIKVYDKGKQSDLKGCEEILRIEERVTNLQYLKLRGINIKMLSDLTKIEELKKLQKLLVETWLDVVFKPLRVSLKSMTRIDKLKYYQFINPNYWIELNKVQRYRAKKKMIEIFNKYRQCNKHSELSELINEKCNFLLNDNSNSKFNNVIFCNRKPLVFDSEFRTKLPLKVLHLTEYENREFKPDLRKFAAQEMYTFFNLECRRKRYTKEFPQTEDNASKTLIENIVFLREKEQEKEAIKKGLKMGSELGEKQTFSEHLLKEEKREERTEEKSLKKGSKLGENLHRQNCIVCEKDTTNKKKNSLYCSKKCNNKTNGMKRTDRNKSHRQEEQENLKRVTKKLCKKSIQFAISYKADSETPPKIYTDTLERSEIFAPPQWIRKIKKVIVSNWNRTAPPLTFTTLRAKELIRTVAELNLREQEERHRKRTIKKVAEHQKKKKPLKTA